MTLPARVILLPIKRNTSKIMPVGILREQLAAAKKELGKPFPQEAELAAKSSRLAELNAQLDMGAQRKPTSQEQEIAKSTRPSVLEGLKRPVPPRAAEKKAKHHEEVR